MRTNSLLRLLIYIEMVCMSYAYLGLTDYQTTDSSIVTDDNAIAVSLVPTISRRRKTKFKSKKHSSKTPSVQQMPIGSTYPKSSQLPTKPYLSPAERGRRIYNQSPDYEPNVITVQIPVNDIDIDKTSTDANELQTAEQCLSKLIPQLESVDQRVRRLYKTSRRRRLYFFDTLLLSTQRFINDLINEAHDLSGALGDRAGKLNTIYYKTAKTKSKKSKKAKLYARSKMIKELLAKTDKLKKKIGYTVGEVDSILDDFVKNFKIAEDSGGQLLIHGDGTLERTR